MAAKGGLRVKREVRAEARRKAETRRKVAEELKKDEGGGVAGENGDEDVRGRLGLFSRAAPFAGRLLPAE